MYRSADMKFSTKDLDQDKWYLSCAISYPGGWWYNRLDNLLHI